MCGRFSLAATPQSFIEHFQIKKGIYFSSRYNLAPGESIPIIKKPGEIEFLRWGFIPTFKSNQEIQRGFINIRSETVVEKISFREAFMRQRCLVMTNGFYEWKTFSGVKQPFFVRRKDQALFAMAGLWEGSTFGIITLSANALLAAVHDRMPVIIPKDDYLTWLDPNTPMEKLSKLLCSISSDLLELYPVTTKMNNAKFESSSCIASLQ